MKIQSSRRALLMATLGAFVIAGCSSMPGMKGGVTEQLSLSGAHEVPAAATSASGSGTVTIHADHSVHARITVTGMNPTAAHIHEGAAGANGPVIVPLTKRGDSEFVAADGAKLTPAQHESYKAGKLYVNVHSAKYPGGELRAQLKGR